MCRRAGIVPVYDDRKGTKLMGSEKPVDKVIRNLENWIATPNPPGSGSCPCTPNDIHLLLTEIYRLRDKPMLYPRDEIERT
jgi:hypothetical protein